MSFGGVHALSGVSFTLHQGEILGLIGPNGAGKTTLFNCITGVVPGYRGDIHYDGRDLRHLKPHQRARLKIARTFQNLELFDELSALDNLVLPLDAFSRRGVIGDLLRLPTTVFDERKAQEKARAILHFLDLGNYADTPAGDLPVGLQRRLEIGRALCLEPRLLLLDEPGAGLDARETAELARLLASVRARFKVTMLVVDHDMALIMRICNRIYVLDYGRDHRRGTAASRSVTTPKWCGRISAAGGCGMSGALLEARGLRTGYGRLPVVFNVDLEVQGRRDRRPARRERRRQDDDAARAVGDVAADGGRGPSRRHVAEGQRARTRSRAAASCTSRRGGGSSPTCASTRRCASRARWPASAAPRPTRASPTCTTSSRACTSGARSSRGRCRAGSSRCSRSPAG